MMQHMITAYDGKNKPEQTSTYWDRLEDESRNYFQRGRLINDLGAYMQDKPCRILEIGCGEGLLLAAIQSRNPKAECYGIELSEKAVEAGMQESKGTVLFTVKHILSGSPKSANCPYQTL